MEDAAQSAGAGDVFLIEAPMSAAIGAGLPVSEPKGCMLMNIGASLTEMVIISLAGIVHSNVLCVGGNEMNSAIMTYLRDKYSLVIGEREAEDIKIKIGTACRPETELAADLVDNGIVLTGGGALLRGLDKHIAAATGLPVRVANDPAHATIEGCGVVVGELNYISKHRRNN